MPRKLWHCFKLRFRLVNDVRPNDAVDTLIAQRSRFRAFVISRLGSEADADDVLQNGLVKALERADEVREEESLIAWFYQVLRNAMSDYIRRRAAGAQREEAWWFQESVTADPDGTRVVCGCFEGLLPTLKPREAELLRRVELGNEPVATVAQSLGLTANNASVVLHRARKELRERLRKFCGDCADGACLDCDCESSSRKFDQSK